MSKALELMYAGGIIGSLEAERIGLVSRVVPDRLLSKTAMALSQKLASGSSVAHEFTKKLTYIANTRNLEEQLWMEGQASVVTGLTDDRKEGTKAFKERREPNFRGHWFSRGFFSVCITQKVWSRTFGR